MNKIFTDTIRDERDECNNLVMQLSHDKYDMSSLVDDIHTVKSNIKFNMDNIKFTNKKNKKKFDKIYREYRLLQERIFVFKQSHNMYNDIFTLSYSHDDIKEAKKQAIDSYDLYCDLVYDSFVLRDYMCEIIKQQK